MPFYIRKSIRAGPLRYNISKSGIGISTGIPGFRIGTGPRGNHIHMGRNGLYYRATLPGPTPLRSNRPPTPAATPQNTLPQPPGIETADVQELHDVASSHLLSELNLKSKKTQFFPLAIISSLVVISILLAGRTPPWLFALAVPLAGLLLVLTRQWDAVSKTTVLFYHLEADAEIAYESLHQAFKELEQCSRVWHIEAQGATVGSTSRGAATSTVRRQQVRPTYNAPPYVGTNISVPTLPAGNQTLYFFPDRLLLHENGNFGSVAYSDLKLKTDNARSIEGGELPPDTQIADKTWQFASKDGSPDRRFRNNWEIPIVLYSDLHLSSSAGLNQLFELSRPNLGQNLANAIAQLASANSRASNTTTSTIPSNEPWYMQDLKNKSI